MNESLDLLIAGGGLVGGTLALALRGSGLRVGVIEPLSDPERDRAPQGERALALSRHTVQTLKSLKLFNAIAEEAAAITRIHVSDRGHFGKVRLSAADRGVETLGHVVRARRLEAEIAAALREEPLIRRYCPARILSLASDPHSVLVSIRDDQGDRLLTAPLLVAADGGHSTVRRLLGIPQSEHDYAQTALITEVITQKDHGGTAFERFTAEGPLALLPLAPRRCSVVWTLESENAKNLLEGPKDSLHQHLQSSFGDWLGALVIDRPVTPFPLHFREARSMVEGRTVLIGNALHTLHPVAGQGFNLGLRDAVVLADHLDSRHRLGRDLGEATSLQGYARLRREDLRRVAQFTDGLVKLFSNDQTPLVIGRNLALMALDRLPGLKRRLVGRAMGYEQSL